MLGSEKGSLLCTGCDGTHNITLNQSERFRTRVIACKQYERAQLCVSKMGGVNYGALYMQLTGLIKIKYRMSHAYS